MKFIYRNFHYLAGMIQQQRAAALLRQAADLLNAPSDIAPTNISCNVNSESSTVNAVSSVRNTTRALFAPYRRASSHSRRWRSIQPDAAVSYWTHKFSIIPRCSQVCKICLIILVVSILNTENIKTFSPSSCLSVRISALRNNEYSD